MKNKKTLLLVLTIILAAITVFGLIIFLVNLNTKKAESPSIQTNQMALNDGEIEYDDNYKEGYDIATTLIFTMGIDRDKAINALKPYMLYKDGQPCFEYYDLEAHWDDTENSNSFRFTVTYPDGTVRGHISSYKVVAPIDGVEFAAISPFSLYSFACVVDKATINEDFDINRIPVYADSIRHNNLTEPVFDLKYEDALNSTNTIFSKSTYRSGNGNYHHAFANVRILDNICIDSFYETIAVDEPTEVTPEVQEPDIQEPQTAESDSIFNKIKNSFNEFKDNFQNNKTYQIVTVAVSSVIGIALIYVIFLIIRKVWRVIKN